MMNLRPHSTGRLLLLLALTATPADRLVAQWIPDSVLGRITVPGNLLSRLPIRSLRDANSLLPFSYVDGDRVYQHQSAAWEQTWALEGISLMDPQTGEPMLTPALEGLSDITVVRSAYDATGTGTTSSLMSLSLPRGGEAWTVGVLGGTDGFGSGGGRFLGTTMQGDRRVAATVSGSILPTLRLFATAEHRRTENRQRIFLTSMSFAGLMTDDLGPRGNEIVPLPGPIEVDENFLPDNGRTTTVVQGLATMDLGFVGLSLVFALQNDEMPLGNDWPGALVNMYRRHRTLRLRESAGVLGLRATIPVHEGLQIDASVAMTSHRSRTSDPAFGDEWRLFTDSAANAQRGFTGFRSKYGGPLPYSTILRFLLEDPNAPNNTFRRDESSGWQFDVSGHLDLSPTMRLVAGLHHEMWALRTYRVDNISRFNVYSELYGPSSFPTEKERLAFLRIQGAISSVGYDLYGQTADAGEDAPAHPSTTRAFGEAQWLGDQFRGSVGASLVSFQPAISTRSRRTMLLLPQAQGSLTIVPNLTLEAGAGYSASLPPLSDLLALQFMSGGSIPDDGYVKSSLVRIPVHSIEPVRSRILENAVRYTGPWFAVRFGAYVRTENNRTVVGRVHDPLGRRIDAMLQMIEPVHESGFSLTADVTPLSFLGLRMWYSWHSFDDLLEKSSKAMATTAILWDPMAFARDQQLRGTLALHSAGVGRMDAEGVYAVGVFSYASGVPLNPMSVASMMGQATAWNIGVIPLFDPRFRSTIYREGAESTPSITQWDLQAGVIVGSGFGSVEVFVSIINLLNTKHVRTEYPMTLMPTTDGWLESGLSSQYRSIPRYEEFYRAINLENRWAYMGAMEQDIYGEPRQIVVGMRVKI